MIINTVVNNYLIAPPVTPHRYWRINITDNGGASVSAILELEMYESQFGPNVCTGGTASASSVLTDTPTNYTASRAFDGSLEDWLGANSSTRDLWAGTGVVEWLKYDFGAGNEKAIAAIGMQCREPTFISQLPTDFTIEYSDDNSNWTVAWTETGLSWSGFEYKRLVDPAWSEPSYTGSPHGSHLYWRYVFMAADTPSNAACIAEGQFRATVGGADQASGGTASASSIFSGSYIASNAFDNNNTTLWSAANATGYSWLQYQFSSAVNVAEIAIISRHDGFQTTSPGELAIQYSDNGTLWTTAWVELGETGWSNTETRVFADPNYI